MLSWSPISFFAKINEQIKDINNKMEVAQAALTHQELLLTNILCVDPGAEVSATVENALQATRCSPTIGLCTFRCVDRRQSDTIESVPLDVRLKRIAINDPARAHQLRWVAFNERLEGDILRIPQGSGHQHQSAYRSPKMSQ